MVRPSADQLQTLGTLFNQGDFLGAIARAEALLNEFPQASELHNVLGAAQAGLGHFVEAAVHFARALQINPHDVDALNNLGTARKELGQLDEAISSYKAALQIKPDFAESHYNLASIFKDIGKLDEAIYHYREAAKINPHFVEAHGNLGHALREAGQVEEAISSYAKSVELNPNRLEYWQGATLALNAMTIEAYNPVYADLCIAIIEKRTLVHPSIILTPVLKLLRQQAVIQKSLSETFSQDLEQNLEKVLVDLSDTALLLRIMEVCPLPDLKIEHLLKSLRRALLFQLNKNSNKQSMLRFQIALASQCWINEFVYGETDEESAALDALEMKIATTIENRDRINPHAIACLASYRPLYHFEWSAVLADSDELAEIFEIQVRQVEEEIALRAKIPALHEVTDSVSRAVQEQYEQNPYPRWVYTNVHVPTEQSSAAAVAKRIGLNIEQTDTLASSAPNILIAGCGTGQQAIISANRFPNSLVLAVDLSLSSLSYAQRKTNEFGIKNIKFMRADILGLEATGRQFDIVESTGVLHHMDDPMAGWTVLEKCLKPGGLMKVSLYSALARQAITAARKKIAESGLSDSMEDILSFRAQVIESGDEDLRALQSWADIYSTSEFRDLVFHVKEHQFTLPQIQNCLDQLDLKFVGFEFGGGNQKRVFKDSYPDPNDLYDLDKWNIFEAAHPNCFAGMYQFWVRKPA